MVAASESGTKFVHFRNTARPPRMPTIAQRSGRTVARAARVQLLARDAIAGNVGAVDVPIAGMFVGVVANAIHAARRAPKPPARIPHALFALGGAFGGAVHRAFQ